MGGPPLDFFKGGAFDFSAFAARYRIIQFRGRRSSTHLHRMLKWHVNSASIFALNPSADTPHPQAVGEYPLSRFESHSCEFAQRNSHRMILLHNPPGGGAPGTMKEPPVTRIGVSQPSWNENDLSYTGGWGPSDNSPVGYSSLIGDNSLIRDSLAAARPRVGAFRSQPGLSAAGEYANLSLQFSAAIRLLDKLRSWSELSPLLEKIQSADASSGASQSRRRVENRGRFYDHMAELKTDRSPDPWQLNKPHPRRWR
jgi:hypothetical protein